MKIFGFSAMSIVLILVLIYVVRKWGGSIPVIQSI